MLSLFKKRSFWMLASIIALLIVAVPNSYAASDGLLGSGYKVLGWVLSLGGYLFWFGNAVFQFALEFTVLKFDESVNGFLVAGDGGGFITIIWNMLRDIINLFIALLFILNATTMALGFNFSHRVKLLWFLLLAGLLNNFSAFIAFVMIDLANLIVLSLYSSITYDTNIFNLLTSDTFTNLFLKIDSPIWGSFFALFMLIFSFGLMLVFLLLGFGFLERYLYMILFMILSPVILFGLILKHAGAGDGPTSFVTKPITELYDKWIGKILPHQLFLYPIVIMFALLIGYNLLENSLGNVIEGINNFDPRASNVGEGNRGLLINLFFSFALFALIMLKTINWLWYRDTSLNVGDKSIKFWQGKWGDYQTGKKIQRDLKREGKNKVKWWSPTQNMKKVWSAVSGNNYEAPLTSVGERMKKLKTVEDKIADSLKKGDEKDSEAKKRKRQRDGQKHLNKFLQNDDRKFKNVESPSDIAKLPNEEHSGFADEVIKWIKDGGEKDKKGIDPVDSVDSGGEGDKSKESDSAGGTSGGRGAASNLSGSDSSGKDGSSHGGGFGGGATFEIPNQEDDTSDDKESGKGESNKERKGGRPISREEIYDLGGDEESGGGEKKKESANIRDVSREEIYDLGGDEESDGGEKKKESPGVRGVIREEIYDLGSDEESGGGEKKKESASVKGVSREEIYDLGSDEESGGGEKKKESTGGGNINQEGNTSGGDEKSGRSENEKDTAGREEKSAGGADTGGNDKEKGGTDNEDEIKNRNILGDSLSGKQTDEPKKQTTTNVKEAAAHINDPDENEKTLELSPDDMFISPADRLSKELKELKMKTYYNLKKTESLTEVEKLQDQTVKYLKQLMAKTNPFYKKKVEHTMNDVNQMIEKRKKIISNKGN